VINTCLVLAKRPEPGRVKTRLMPDVTADVAARLAHAAILDTLDAVERAPFARRVLVLDRPCPSLARPGWRIARQTPGGLDRRIASALRTHGLGGTLLVGMDTPQVQPHHVDALDFDRYDAALGLAADGGYWAIALRDPSLAGAAIRGVPMSTVRTGSAQWHRLLALGLRVQLLDKLTDADTIADAHAVARQAPRTRFARLLAAQSAAVAS
jgi:hypothetical protein